MSKKIIAVLGATGTQGGGVARDLLKDGEFAVRAVTRNPDSASSQELKALGAEVVRGDTADTASLTAAFQGVYGVFGVTDFWALFFKNNFDQPKTEAEETQHGKNIVDAAKAAGVKHFVWSTLDGEDELKTTHIYHFISKARVDPYLKASGIPYTLIRTSFYYNNLILTGFEVLKPLDDGSYLLNLAIPPDVKIHSFDGSDVGRWAVPAFKDPSKYNGKTIDAVSEFLSPVEYKEIIERVSGKKVVLPEITHELFNSAEFREKITDELWLNWNGWVVKEIKRDFDNSRAVAPNPITLETYIKTNPKIRKHLKLD